MSALPATVHTLKPQRLVLPPPAAGDSTAEPPLYVRTRAPDWLPRVLAPLAGLALFGVLWAAIAHSGGRLPDPVATWHSALEVFANPFYRKGPNDQGIGWNVLTSLGRVGVGFGLAALVGIPLGFMLGRFRFLSDMAAPIISILKPVSPEGKDEAGYVVAVDTVSAGFRERVIAVSGSSARMAEGCKDTPVDTAIIGIVDDVAMD